MNDVDGAVRSREGRVSAGRPDVLRGAGPEGSAGGHDAVAAAGAIDRADVRARADRRHSAAAKVVPRRPGSARPPARRLERWALAAGALALGLGVAACGGEGGAGGPAGRAPAGAGPDAATADSSGAATGGAGEGLRVVVLGTSLTAGLGIDPDSAYPALLQRKADSAGIAATVVNAGVSGETSAGALRRVDWVLRDGADVLVVETGANDGLRGQSVDSLRANLEAIVARARAAEPAVRILLLRMEALPNFGSGYTARFRAVYPEVAEKAGVTLGPFLLDSVAGVPALNQPDGVHPTPAGARVVARTVWAALRPVLDSAQAARRGRGSA